MDRRISFPVFGNAPKDYDAVHLNDLARKLNQLVSLMRSPGEGRNTNIVLTNLPTNDYGLEPGTLFSVSGAVRISLLNIPYPGGVSSKTYVGTVSVTT